MEKLMNIIDTLRSLTTQTRRRVFESVLFSRAIAVFMAATTAERAIRDGFDWAAQAQERADSAMAAWDAAVALLNPPVEVLRDLVERVAEWTETAVARPEQAEVEAEDEALASFEADEDPEVLAAAKELAERWGANNAEKALDAFSAIRKQVAARMVAADGELMEIDERQTLALVTSFGKATVNALGGAYARAKRAAWSRARRQEALGDITVLKTARNDLEELMEQLIEATESDYIDSDRAIW